LRRRLTQGQSLEDWSAHDATLQREVGLTIVASDHPNRAGILDAARRAAGVEDSRLVRILDVTTADGHSFIVQESLSGAESLADILVHGALPAEEARRIAGETASGLETARQRGLHHLRLNPHHVLRAGDGAIKVSGVAVAAAIDGSLEEQEPDPITASRRDAISVVAVTYAALTSRWPLPERVFGVEPAPRVVGGVPAPSEIAAGVPGDLDALCRMTLNEDAGPLSPGDFASQIAPWSRGPVHRPGVDPTVVLHLPGHSSHPRAHPHDVGKAEAWAGEPTVAISTHYDPTQDAWSGSGSVESAAPADGSEPQGGPSAGDNAVATGAVAAKAVVNALADASAAAAVARGRIGSFARAAADKSAARAARGDDDLGGELMTLPQALSGQVQEIEPPLPMLPASTAQHPDGIQSRVVMIIVSAFVALSLLVGYCGTRGLGSISLPNSPSKPTVAGKGTARAPAPAATPARPSPGRPIAILSASGFDPDGDQQENDSAAPRVYDGSPSTAWSTEGYNTADFGHLGKKGVGVLLDLGQATSVNHLTLDLGTEPVDVTVYAAADGNLEGATVIGSKAAVSGRWRLDAATTMPRAQFVIIWFTNLAQDGSRFRASLSEIALS
jgi:hypothetical protein